MIDVHCHIDQYNNPIDVIQLCENAGIKVIGMTNLPSHFELGYPHVQSFKRFRLALGMHPLHAENHQKEFPIFLKNLSKTSYIGEIGLDFSREGYSTTELQLSSFTSILKEVSKKRKILSLHSRRAEKEVFDLLIKNEIENAIFHWYSGPLALINKIADAGYYFSINTAMVKSETGQKIIRRIPLDKILTESDGPFIDYSGRPVLPTDLGYVETEIGRLVGKTKAEVSSIVKENFQLIIDRIRI